MDNFFFLVIVTGLATWRITSIIQKEKIFEPIRKWLGEKEISTEIAPGNIISYTESTTFISELVSCFMCLSVWIGLACTILLFVYPYILMPFFLSAVAIIINVWLSRY